MHSVQSSRMDVDDISNILDDPITQGLTTDTDCLVFVDFFQIDVDINRSIHHRSHLENSEAFRARGINRNGKLNFNWRADVVLARSQDVVQNLRQGEPTTFQDGRECNDSRSAINLHRIDNPIIRSDVCRPYKR